MLHNKQAEVLTGRPALARVAPPADKAHYLQHESAGVPSKASWLDVQHVVRVVSKQDGEAYSYEAAYEMKLFHDIRLSSVVAERPS